MPKVDNFGNLSRLDMFFTRIAKEQFVTHRFSKEYRIVLIIVFLVDLLAVAVSIFAGYFYLNSIVFKTINSVLVSQAITISALILLEILVHIGLAKFFKNFIKTKMQVALIALIIVTALWSTSFHLSTKGLSMRQSKKVSKVEDIALNFDLEKGNLESYRNEQIKEIQNLQQEIKKNPTRWSKGSLSLLSEKQIQTIKDLQNDISVIKQQYRTDLLALQGATDKAYTQDEINTQSEAKEYFNIIVVVMFIELISSGFLMFSWSQVLKQNKNEDYINSKVNDIANDIDKGVSTLVQNRFITLTNALELALGDHRNNSIPFEYNKASIKNKDIPEAEIVNKKNIGFMANYKGDKGIKTCAWCGADISNKKHWNAKYCNDDCRGAAWEKDKGTKFYKRKK